MLSRRNVRIKVMQVLYSMTKNELVNSTIAIQRYDRMVFKSYQTFLVALSTFTRVAHYSIMDADIRKRKLRPTPYDLSFTAKLGQNPLIKSLLNNDGLNKLFVQNKTKGWTSNEKIVELYLSFAKSDAYRAYIEKPSKTKDHLQMLLTLFKHLNGNENFNEIVEDFNALWNDDKSLVVGSIKRIIKNLPAAEDFHEQFNLDKDTVEEFGQELLIDVVENDDQYLKLIEPALNNWDAERVAILDMILIKMGLSEFVNFESIPTKVTLNEFVDLAKLYSTDKSKEFINGILDRLLKQLQKDGTIIKEGRGLIG